MATAVPSSDAPPPAAAGPDPTVEILGSGVIGLTAADAFLRRGATVRLISASDGPDAGCCSWWAGGMLAPECEMETAEPLIGALGDESVAYWRREADPAPVFDGTLVVAPARDATELKRFARRTQGWRRLDADGVAALEPALKGRFQAGLVFPSEGRLDPRRVLAALKVRLAAAGVRFETGKRLSDTAAADAPETDFRIDCRGLGAQAALPDLRGVRGEMLILRAPGVRLRRTVRLLHPRSPIYVVPREHDHYMIGATMIESGARGGPSLRSVLELTAAAYALHPGFGEAEIIEIGADARPAFPDNLPRIRRQGRILHVNGAYRHGFLLAPALARRAAEIVLDGAEFPEVSDDYSPERRAAAG